VSHRGFVFGRLFGDFFASHSCHPEKEILMRKFTLLSSVLLASFLATIQAADSSSMNLPATSTAKTAEIQTGGNSDAYYEKTFPVIKQKALLKDLQKKDVVTVDANGTESYASGHIPGAIDFAASGDKFASMLPDKKDALIVAYCGGPGCEAWRKAADKLHALGYTNVRHYKGGIQEWKTSKQPVEKAG
jgi:rhodanese-related sulfurtransferase